MQQAGQRNSHPLGVARSLAMLTGRKTDSVEQRMAQT
jgi:hypothetical protein